MKDLMICILALAWVLEVIYVMDGHRRGARHFLRGCLSLHGEEEAHPPAYPPGQPPLGTLLDKLEKAIQTHDPKAMGWARMIRERTGGR